jgi:two-component system, cell cycle response regulator
MTDETTHTEQTPPANDKRRSGGAAAYLVTIAGIRVGEMFKLGKEETLLGRGDDADLRLIDEGVSRRHAAVVREGDRVVLKDLGSVNGTFCNGSRISEALVLNDGDKISMGGATILKFTYQDDLEEQFSKNLYESAVKDGLTRLHNRRYFDERLRSELTFANRHLATLALLMVDVDHFKRINDERGHQTGDTTLREIARRLASAMRVEDVVARFGGEEFAVICRSTGETEAKVVAERLRAIIAEEISIPDGPPLRVTASIGIAVVPKAGLRTELDLVNAADRALYAAKRNGRNRSVVFGDESSMLKVEAP